jgi:hypothetical protein
LHTHRDAGIRPPQHIFPRGRASVGRGNRPRRAARLPDASAGDAEAGSAGGAAKAFVLLQRLRRSGGEYAGDAQGPSRERWARCLHCMCNSGAPLSRTTTAARAHRARGQQSEGRGEMEELGRTIIRNECFADRSKPCSFAKAGSIASCPFANIPRGRCPESPGPQRHCCGP